MSDYHYSVRVVEINDATRTIYTVFTAIFSLVCTADDADATAFSLNMLVLLTNVQAVSLKPIKKARWSPRCRRLPTKTASTPA